MSGAASRLSNILGHLWTPPSLAPSSSTPTTANHIHQLSPTFFLPRAASIEPNAPAIVHITSDNKTIRRTYQQFADRAKGIAYFLKKHNFKRVGILAPNTPAFLECLYGIVAAGGVFVPVNYRLKEDDIAYIFEFAEVDAIVVDREFEVLLGLFRKMKPGVKIIIDHDVAAETGSSCGPYNEAVQEGLKHDKSTGGHGWAGLHAHCTNEDDMLAIPFTSGTTSRPKGVMYTHRGAYLAAMANVVESALNPPTGRCRYLWTLPMFHAVGWTFPWSVVAVRGTNICLRKIDYPLIWRLLREENITHFNAAPTVNTLLVADAAASRLSNPVQVTVAASPPSAYLFERMTSLNLQPVHTYGMTETYGPITKGYILPEWDDLVDKSEKYALMARQGHGFVTSLPVRVVRQDKPAELVDVAKDGKEIGEIVFFGNICAKGYYKNETATKELFAGGGLHSGDLAVWHPDGSVQILDRAKDIIISGGENISSVALESALVKHPDILEAGVVAVANEQWGESPMAFVTIKHGKTLAGEQIIEWARHQSAISRFMVPRFVEIVDELPKTSTGKIKKNELRELARRTKPR